MGNFFGNVDDPSLSLMGTMGFSQIVGFFIFGACLLAASWLVAWQVKRVKRVMDNLKEQEKAGKGAGDSPESPKV